MDSFSFLARHEKLQDKLELLNDEVAECKIDLLNRKNLDMNFKDTHMETMRALLKACSVPVDQKVVEEDGCWIYVKNFSCNYN